MTSYVAGIDSGTTGIAVIIFDLKGNIISEGYSEYPCKFPNPAWVEQSMHDVWIGLCKASRQAFKYFKDDPKKIKSIGLSSQRGTFVPIDEDWNPLADALVWSDMRAEEENNWVIDKFGREGYHEISGLEPSAMWAYPKYKWFIDNNPDIHERTWKYVNGQEWIMHKLGSNQMYTVASCLNMNGMSNVQTLEWSDELINAIGLTRDKLPEIIEPLTVVGEVSEQAALETGFAPGTILTPGGGDQQCAAVGAGVIYDGMAEITLGTGTTMVAHVEELQDDLNPAVLFGSHAIPNRWDMEGIANTSGAGLRWWRDTIGDPEREAAKVMNVDPYDLITLEATKSPLGANGLLFLPYFNGQVTPNYHDNARGGFLGLSQIHNRNDTARSVLEGAIYELRMIVEAMEESAGKPFDKIRLSGGGSRSDFWAQMQADIYGRPVERLKVTECSALGAAILGAVGAGIFDSVEEAVEVMIHTIDHLEPNMNNHKKYTKMYDVFVQTFESLKNGNVFNDLVRVNLEIKKEASL